MRKILLLILILPTLTYCQSTKTYLELVDEVKTEKNADEIENLIIGTWEFLELTDNKGNGIKEISHFVNDTITASEIVSRPSMRIRKDKTYELFNCSDDYYCNKGTWNYDQKTKILTFNFDKPKYNVPVENLADGLLEQLIESGTLIEFSKDEIEIAEITETELKVIDFLPSNETELKYNLKIYAKK